MYNKILKNKLKYQTMKNTKNIYLFEYNNGWSIDYIVKKLVNDEEAFNLECANILNEQNPHGDTYNLVSRLKSYPDNWEKFKPNEFLKFIDVDWYFSRYKKRISKSTQTVDTLGGFNFQKINEDYLIGENINGYILTKNPIDNERLKHLPAIELYGDAAAFVNYISKNPNTMKL